MPNQFEISFSVEDVSLSLKVSLLLLLFLPLFAEHLSLKISKLAFLVLSLLAGVFLPVKD